VKSSTEVTAARDDAERSHPPVALDHVAQAIKEAHEALVHAPHMQAAEKAMRASQVRLTSDVHELRQERISIMQAALPPQDIVAAQMRFIDESAADYSRTLKRAIDRKEVVTLLDAAAFNFLTLETSAGQRPGAESRFNGAIAWSFLCHCFGEHLKKRLSAAMLAALPTPTESGMPMAERKARCEQIDARLRQIEEQRIRLNDELAQLRQAVSA
jgi:hypothetical protein